MKNNIDKITVFVPANTRLNFENKDQEPPTVQYNIRKTIIDLEDVKKIVGGEYGRKAKNKWTIPKF